MRIGELAQRAGVNPQSIRFYERRKLLRPASRTGSGYRIYDERDLEIVLAVKQIQELGFTLKEIRELLELHPLMRSARPGGRRGVEGAMALAHRRLASIDEKMRLLRKMRRDLSQWLELLEQRASAACPVAKAQSKSDR
jgi:DNA-binding transcriptional MerR regulator